MSFQLYLLHAEGCHTFITLIVTTEESAGVPPSFCEKAKQSDECTSDVLSVEVRHP